MEIKDEIMSPDIGFYIIKNNQNKNQKSYFMGDDYSYLKEIYDNGGKLYTCYENNTLIGACLLDIVNDNNSIKIIGPFGDSNEIRIKLIEKIKNDYSSYRLLLYVNENNSLIEIGKILSTDLSMELYLTESFMNPHVFSLKKEDYTSFGCLHDSIFPHAYYNGLALASLKEETILVYIDSNNILGYIAFNIEEMCIDFIGVEINSRNEGIGKILVKSALSMMKKKEIIHLSVNKSNISAVKLYEKCGFRTHAKMISVEL